MEKKRRFADDLDQGKDTAGNEEGSDMNQYDTLHDKWNHIQADYLEKYPALETEELYFEGGGFEGLLEKISQIRGKSTDEVRTEIENW